MSVILVPVMTDDSDSPRSMTLVPALTDDGDNPRSVFLGTRAVDRRR